MDNIIKVTQTALNKAVLQYKDLKTHAFLGECGTTNSKQEGDKKTPLGLFDLGICFGTHKKEEIDKKLIYFEINQTHYWVDDSFSKYYNQLVDTSQTLKDWNSAEHLLSFKKQYEYAIEIISNPKNIPNKGSAIFLHCSVGRPTSGCISIEKEDLVHLMNLIDENTKILIQ